MVAGLYAARSGTLKLHSQFSEPVALLCGSLRLPPPGAPETGVSRPLL